jgi:uncharacterized protein (UPF0276 family)
MTIRALPTEKWHTGALNVDALPTLGAGLGFRAPFLSDVFLHRSDIDFLEIVADHYFDPTPRKSEELELLAAHFPLIPHGLDLSLGSAEGLDDGYVQRMAALVNRLDPPWWSEHIAFTRAGGVDIGHLAPMPFTREALDVLCRNIRRVQAQIAAPMILENITYTLQWPGADMTEAQFLTELVERTDCGLLLDITNLYTNAVNWGYDPLAFLDGIPLEKVVQFHFVGGEWQAGQLVDSHSQPTPPEVWQLMREACRRTSVKGILLERDENLPPFEEIVGELAQARETGKQWGRWD